MAYNGGEDIGAVVIALGAHTLKAGDAGDDSPKAVFSSKYGVVDAQHAKPRVSLAPRDEQEPDAMDIDEAGGGVAESGYFFDADALHFREHQRIETPFDAHGIVQDWDQAAPLLSEAFSRLGIDADSAIDRPLLFSEPTLNPKENREKMTQFLFEKYKPSGLFIAKDATLAAFASGRSTAAVVDCGESASTVSIVHDGYVLRKTLQRSDVGGRKLSETLQRILTQKAGHEIRPRYLFEKRKGKGGKVEVKPVVRSNVTPSYHNFELRSIVDDVKLSHCKVALTLAAQETPLVLYEFPEGLSLQLDKEFYALPELLFRPSYFSEIVKDADDLWRTEDGTERLGVAEMLSKAIAESDPDLKRDLYQNTIITGGSSLFPGFSERLQADVVTPSMYKMKVIAPSSSTERRFANWIGGSILASLGSFNQMWISKEEYDEVGSNIVHKKCP